jgi:hypothetical protein
MEPARQRAQLPERRQQILDAALDRRRGGGLGPPGHEPQRQRNPDEPLLGSVVESRSIGRRRLVD